MNFEDYDNDEIASEHIFLSTMTTRSRTTVEVQSFPQFNQFPLEIQQIVWRFAVLCCHDPFIPLYLSDRENYTSPYQDENRFPLGPWKHMFRSPNAPVLLKTCTESRKAALEFYNVQGWESKATGWEYVRQEGDARESLQHCDISEDLEKFGKSLYWRPETDVVLFQHREEPYACDERSICNTYKPCYNFRIDERVRFIAMSKEIYEYGDESPILQIPGLEIVFVLTDFTPHVLRWEKMNRSEDEINILIGERCDELEKKWMEANMYDADIFPWEEKYGSEKSNVQIRAVRSLLEIEEIVAGQPLPAKQVESKELPTPDVEAEE